MLKQLTIDNWRSLTDGVNFEIVDSLNELVSNPDILFGIGFLHNDLTGIIGPHPFSVHGFRETQERHNLVVDKSDFGHGGHKRGSRSDGTTMWET